MVKFDIIIVTYNSEKWLPGFFGSLEKVEYPLGQLSIIFVDNNSSDNTVTELQEYSKAWESRLASFQILKQNENLGFGKANNLGAKRALSTKLFFLNIDTEWHSGTLTELDKEIYQLDNDEFGVWELRQWPYEHPKLYNPLTGETPWASGAAMIIDLALFNKIKGFDNDIFMYCEDIDLSWRVLMEGKKIKYLPAATVTHYSYESADQLKPTQYYQSAINKLYLRFKFAGLKDILVGNLMFLKMLKGPLPFKKARSKLLRHYFLSGSRFFKAWLWNVSQRKKISRARNRFWGISFKEWDYSVRRKGSFYVNDELNETPLVSVIVRSYNRPPSIIRETLQSLRNQTYKNFEVLLVEDGTQNAKHIIDEFEDLNIRYMPMPENKGRSTVGNIGMREAKGEYINFLDDDDIFFSDHLEVMVRELVKDKQLDAVYGKTFETPIKSSNSEPYEYSVCSYNTYCDQAFNPLLLIMGNYIPIQAVMFKKELFQKHGGFDESISYMEDWDLWLRYLLNSNVTEIDKTTSIFRVTNKKDEFAKRKAQLDAPLKYLQEKHASLIVNKPLSEIQRYTKNCLLAGEQAGINLPLKSALKLLIVRVLRKCSYYLG